MNNVNLCLWFVICGCVFYAFIVIRLLGDCVIAKGFDSLETFFSYMRILD